MICSRCCVGCCCSSHPSSSFADQPAFGRHSFLTGLVIGWRPASLSVGCSGVEGCFWCCLVLQQVLCRLLLLKLSLFQLCWLAGLRPALFFNRSGGWLEACLSVGGLLLAERLQSVSLSLNDFDFRSDCVILISVPIVDHARKTSSGQTPNPWFVWAAFGDRVLNRRGEASANMLIIADFDFRSDCGPRAEEFVRPNPKFTVRVGDFWRQSFE